MSTPRRFSLIFIKLTFFFSFFAFSMLHLIAEHGLQDGVHLSALCWTTYVMCLPFSGGGILLYPLAPLVGALSWYVWELWAWICSILLHSVTLCYNRSLYEKTSITHFIYWAITHPVPYWGLFIICFLPIIATWLYRKHHIPSNALWYYQIRFLLILIALFLLAYIGLHDLIILSNIYA